MCGIVGAVNKTFSDAVFATLVAQLQQRGPDDSGSFIDEVVAFGHRRLSILDLDTGQQPMFSADKSVVIIFNGEIYNYLELRQELVVEGVTFLTRSDTEVLLKAYLQYGIDGMLERVEGMFAFALHDFHIRQTYVARDRFGEKPLYYLEQSDSFVFASELKALTPLLENKQIDKSALNFFLSLTYIPAPYSIYKSIKKMLPGTYFCISAKGTITKVVKYYNLAERIQNRDTYDNFSEAKTVVQDLLRKSVRQRMIADVPIGAFLSGGIDSSIISILMNEATTNAINTFSIGFKEKVYDESDRAKIVADQIQAQHHTKTVQSKDMLEIVDDVIDYYDEPYGDSSAIPAFYLSQLASEKVKVVLTGDCADELFGGYEKYLADYYAKRYNLLPGWLRKLVAFLVDQIPFNRFTNVWQRKLKKVIDNASYSSFDLHYRLMCLGFQDEERQELLTADHFVETKQEIEKIYFAAPTKDQLGKSSYTDIHILLEGDMLTKVDRICMRHSLESRVPFLDTQLVEAALRIPSQHKIKNRNKKYVLKEAFKDILDPRTISYRKKGFGSPVDVWFKYELQSELREALDEEVLKAQGFFDPELVKRLLEEHLSGKQNHKSKLWNLFVFQKWYKKNILEA